MWMSPHHRIKQQKIIVLVHILAGIFCGVLYHFYSGLAVLLSVTFVWFEYEEAKAIHDKGYKDVWEFMVGCGIGAFALLLLRLLGVLK